MRSILSAHTNWETEIAPRLILGLWHPKFVGPALSILPALKRCFIGIDLTLASHPIFWENMHAFSIAFQYLSTWEGKQFRERCQREGKGVYSWTLNRQEQWALAAQWDIDAVMTDKPLDYLKVRQEVLGGILRFILPLPPSNLTLVGLRLAAESGKLMTPIDTWFMWKSITYYTPVLMVFLPLMRRRLELIGGPMQPYLTSATPENPTDLTRSERQPAAEAVTSSDRASTTLFIEISDPPPATPVVAVEA
jgi:hypothetical protein